MKCVASRYYEYAGSKKYDIVTYKNKTQARDHPHDYIFYFSKREWRGFGCRVPGPEEVMPCEITARPIPKHATKKKR